MPRIKTCQRCKTEGAMRLSSYCGVYVCDECSYHDGLARCYCGWSLGGHDGAQELREMGENIEEDY